MNRELLFAERQKFRQWWIWLIILWIDGLFIYEVIVPCVYGKQIGTNPMSDTGIWIATVCAVLIPLLFLSAKLDTEITKDGVRVRLFPFQWSFKFYSWKEISKAYVREYKPIREFGGWGLRGWGKNKALNVSGHFGLQLELTGDRKLLIGTDRPEELAKILEQLKER